MWIIKVLLNETHVDSIIRTDNITEQMDILIVVAQYSELVRMIWIRIY